jgi:hypothetical protein
MNANRKRRPHVRAERQHFRRYRPHTQVFWCEYGQKFDPFRRRTLTLAEAGYLICSIAEFSALSGAVFNAHGGVKRYGETHIATIGDKCDEIWGFL